MSEQYRNVEERLTAAARAVEPNAAFSAALWTQIAQKSRRETNRPAHNGMFLRSAWAAAAFLLFLGLTFILIFPQNAATAFEAIVRYLPGIGFVQDEPSTLYVAGPLRFEQGGATLVIDGAVADAQNTVISYHIEGLPGPQDAGGTACFYDVNRLRFTDGKEYPPIGGSAHGSTARVEFRPLPPGVKETVLYVSMLVPEPGCIGPGSFTAALQFGPRPANMTPLPVLEDGAQGDASVEPGAPPAPGTVNPPAASADPETAPGAQDVTFHIDRVVPMRDELLLVGHVDWQNPLWLNVRLDMPELLVRDASGKTIPAIPDEAGERDNLFAYRLQGSKFDGPLTLTITTLHVHAMFEDGPGFEFDAGQQPAPGQTWEVNRELDVLGQTLRVRSVRAVRDETGQAPAKPVNGYAVIIEQPPAVEMVDFACRNESPGGDQFGGWGSGRMNADGTYSQEMYFEKEIPLGKVTCRTRNLFYRIQGSWELTWQPPEAVQ